MKRGTSFRALACLLSVLMLGALAVAIPGTADAQAGAPFTSISFGDRWSYLDDGSNQGTDWRAAAFDDAGWSTGLAKLGYGNNDESTVINFGDDPANKFRTSYFRKDFIVPPGVQSAELSILRDDGAVVYINGVQVGADNMPSSFDYQTFALGPINNANEAIPVNFTIDPALLQPGANVLAVEIHQSSSTSSDVVFDLQLSGFADSDDSQAPTVPSGLVSTSSTGSTTTLQWNPSVDNIAVQNYRVYRDGTLVGMVSHPSTTITDTGLTDSTSFSYQVSALDQSGNESALSGGVIASTTQDATLDLSRRAEDTWQTNGPVWIVLPIGDTIFIGGEFSNLNDGNGNSVARNNLAAIDRITGLPTSFNPDMNDKVFALTPSPDGATLYVGGSFTTASSQVRKRVAAFDVATGALGDFKPPAPNKSVRGIGTDGATVYIGGLFDQVGGTSRNHLAAFDIETNALTSWAPSADDGVKAILVDPDKVWAAGDFSFVNGSYAGGLAAITTSGALLPGDSPGHGSADLAAQGNQIFVAVGGSGGGRAQAYNRTTGAQQWSVVVDGNVQGVGVVGDFAYFGGHHGQIGPDEDGDDPVGRLTRHNVITGEPDRSWLPYFNGIRAVNDVAAEGYNVYVGGDFNRVSGNDQVGFALFADEPDTPAPVPELTSITMLDTDSNGRIDTVEAEFDSPLAPCASPCTDGWTFTNSPSRAVLDSVTTSGSTATLNLTEGPGKERTSGDGFTIELTSETTLRGVGSTVPITFAAQPPIDGAGPVPVAITRTNAGTSGLAEAGDTFKIAWSESLDASSVPTQTIVSISEQAGTNELTIAGIAQGSIDLGSNRFLSSGQADFATSAVIVRTKDTAVLVTLSPCSGDCANLTSGRRTSLTVVADSSIRDLAGNSAVGSISKTFKPF